MNEFSWWFDSLDWWRRQQGGALDAMGLGPKESTYRVVSTSPGVRLRHYGAVSSDGSDSPALLIVPAPIKRPYIWDIAPEKSIVCRAKAQGFDVYMVEWTEPGEREASFGLKDYAGTMINHCVDVIARHSPQSPVFLAGHSLGGTFAALYAAYQPERVAALILLEAPVRFAEASGAFRGMIESDVPADSLLAPSDHIPGSLLNLVSVAAAPATYLIERHLDYIASHHSPEDWQTHWRGVRWTLDEFPLSRTLFNEVVERLYRGDHFMRGELAFDNTKLHPGAVKAPLLAVYDPASSVIPPESVLDFYRAASSPVKQLVAYSGDTGVALQHIGVLIGDNAHHDVWPQIFDWLNKQRAKARGATA